LNALKYFCESLPDLHVATSGSYLGVSLTQPASFPVGKVNFLRLFPMNFHEFLMATGHENLLAFCARATVSEPLPEMILEQLQNRLREYLLVGGMPAVVQSWIEFKDMARIEQRQSELLLAYERDFAKHANKSMVPKLWQVWDSIPAQLAKENKKFQYSKMTKGARAKDYEDSVSWLCNTGLVHKVTKISKPGLPLSAYENPDSFKMYLLDVGLLRVKAGLPAQALLQGDALFTEFKGSLMENFFLQEYLSHHSRKALGRQAVAHYWTSDARAEVDFVLTLGDSLLPVEIKSGNSLHSKSLRLYMERYHVEQSLRISPLNLRLDGGILNVPLSMISELQRLQR
jgi:uncharacterized protein